MNGSDHDIVPPDPTLFAHLRDFFALPFVVTVIVPFFIYKDQGNYIPEHFLLQLLGMLFFLPGLALLIYTIVLFGRVGRGTLAPWRPTRQLVITGPYKYCRNPMISGVFFMLVGESLILHSLNIMVWALLFFILNNFYFIYKEEPGLHRRFGAAYERYKEHVPRWIPRLTPYEGHKKSLPQL